MTQDDLTDEAIFECFRTPSGQAVLAFLRGQCLQVIPSDSTPTQFAFQEGRRHMVAEINDRFRSVEVRLAATAKATAPVKVKRPRRDPRDRNRSPQ
jgi:hypothetical protein